MLCRFLIPVAFLLALPLRPATLTATGQTALPGQTLIVSLGFSSDAQTVAGLQFDLDWDQPFDLKLVVGDQLRGSTKFLFTNSLGPHTLRCLIVGMDIGGWADGELLKLFVIVGKTAQPGAAEVRLTNTFATDPSGDAIAMAPVSFGIDIQAGGGTSISLPAGGILNAASLLPGPISPGEIVTLLGGLPVDAKGTLLFNGVAAPLLYAGLDQVNAIVPFGLDLSAPATLEVRIGDHPLKVAVPVVAATPAIFTQGSSGYGPGAILNQDYTINSISNPAARGSVIMVYGTGFGTLDPQPADGQPAPGPASTTLPVSATIGGAPATVLYSGAAPQQIAGLTQINLQVPDNIPPDPAAPIVLTIGSTAIPAGVTVAIQ